MGTTGPTPDLSLSALSAGEDIVWYLASSGELVYTEESVRRAMATIWALSPEVENAAEVFCDILKRVEALDRKLREREQRS